MASEGHPHGQKFGVPMGGNTYASAFNKDFTCTVVTIVERFLPIRCGVVISNSERILIFKFQMKNHHLLLLWSMEYRYMLEWTEGQQRDEDV